MAIRGFFIPKLLASLRESGICVSARLHRQAPRHPEKRPTRTLSGHSIQLVVEYGNLVAQGRENFLDIVGAFVHVKVRKLDEATHGRNFE
jgi:hypothetical protein